ncbi:MAG: phage portal protein [Clostridia bacterium]|nr:phage portal protein [Clostridia bacterium]
MPQLTVQEILQSPFSPDEKIALLSVKPFTIRPWKGAKGIEREYDTSMHPVMDKGKYKDIITNKGVKEVSRITLPFQELAADRMTQLVTGIPVQRVYKPQTDRQKELAAFIEDIYKSVRIDNENINRFKRYFAGCEIMTLWYAVEQPTTYNDVECPLKFRCRTFSPMLGDSLYPMFDEYGDMVAMSIGYTRKVGRRTVRYFDCYTDTQHMKWTDETGTMQEVENEQITIGKIPCVYVWRERPIWKDTSNIVYSMEWALSRNDNYLADNSKPRFVVCADEAIKYGDEKDRDEETMAVLQFPAGATAQYVTWNQAKENLEFQINNLRNLYFTSLQLPDWSYEKMSQIAMSGESRKQLTIDGQLKVNSESGPLVHALDRESNIIKSFVKIVRPSDAKEIDKLPIQHVITPFTITDEKDTINNLMTANGNQPIISQRESIELYGQSDDVDKTLQEIREESKADAFNLTE